MNSKLRYIFFLLLSFLFSVFCFAEEIYQYTTPDRQFNIITHDKKVLEITAPLSENLKTKIMNNLNIFFLWERPAEIAIYAKKERKKSAAYFFYNKRLKGKKLKGIQTFRQDKLEEKVLFPAITSLVLSEIVCKEKKIKKIEGEVIKLPLCLIEGLWRSIAEFNNSEKLKKIQEVTLSSLLKTQKLPETPEIFYIKATSLVDFLMQLPYGGTRLRKLIADLYNSAERSRAKKVLSMYKGLFQNEEEFNRKWKEYIEATILALEYEKKMEVEKTLEFHSY